MNKDRRIAELEELIKSLKETINTHRLNESALLQRIYELESNLRIISEELDKMIE